MAASLLIETKAEGDTEKGVSDGKMRLRMCGCQTQRNAFEPHSVSPYEIVAVPPDAQTGADRSGKDPPARHSRSSTGAGSADDDVQPERLAQGVPQIRRARFDADMIERGANQDEQRREQGIPRPEGTALDQPPRGQCVFQPVDRVGRRVVVGRVWPADGALLRRRGGGARRKNVLACPVAAPEVPHRQATSATGTRTPDRASPQAWRRSARLPRPYGA